MEGKLEVINKKGVKYIFTRCKYFQYIPSTHSWKIVLSEWLDFPCTIFFKVNDISSIGWL